MHHLRVESAIRMDGCVIAQMRILIAELPYLTVGTPPAVSEPGIAHIGDRDPVRATGLVEPSGELQGERFAVDESVLACRRNRPIVEARGVSVSLLNASDFGGHQKSTVFEVFRAIPGPDLELPMMGAYRLAVLGGSGAG